MRVVIGYQPGSRRPIAGLFRKTARLAVRVCMRWGVHPDVISYGSMVAAGAAAACFCGAREWAWLLLAGPLFCYVRLWMNMLDGMVALAAGKASLRGEILNDLPDRVSDVVIFVGVAHSGWCHLESGYGAAVMAVMTAYVGMLGQAVGGKRQYGGVMSKPWRMVVLSVGAVLAYGLGRGEGWGGLTILDWTCLAIVVGCVQTMGVRLRRIFKGLREREGLKREDMKGTKEYEETDMRSKHDGTAGRRELATDERG